MGDEVGFSFETSYFASELSGLYKMIIYTGLTAILFIISTI